MIKLKSKIARCCGIALVSAFGFSACSEKIDDSNLYTFVGQTIEDYLSTNEQFSDFNYILKRTGYDAILSGYGSYTCFAPSNASIERYVDSLYNDDKSELAHNGMTAPGLEGLTDSLCEDIGLMHLLYSERTSVEMTSGRTFMTILGRDISTSTDSTGAVVLNSSAKISDVRDVELENGMLHEVTNVITHSNNLLNGELAKHPEYSIFDEALVRTGLADTLSQTRKIVNGQLWSYDGPTITYHTNSQGTRPLYVPRECAVGFTIFAESNEVLAKNGINSFDDLVAYANEQYKNCAQSGSGWYDYYRNAGVNVSTGTDYTDRNNALNMFVRYHILNAWLRPSDLAYGPGTTNRYAMSQETPAVNYFETLLPNTMLRINYENTLQQYYINRWRANNTLTDQVGGFGTASMHELRDEGVLISDKDPIQTSNGAVFPISKMLVYNQNVPGGVMDERMRFDVPAMFPELYSNKLIHLSTAELANMYPEGMNDNIWIPSGFLDKMILYNDNESRVQYHPTEMDGEHERWYCWQADEFGVTGNYDVALRLPPVPDGYYEIRIGYQPINGTGTGHRSMTQMYLGVGSSDPNRMIPLDIPLDMRVTPNDNADGSPDYLTGWCNPNKTDDEGQESDGSMRNLGYMRAPKGMLIRGGGTARNYPRTIRRIVGKVHLNQGVNWLRFKSVLDDTSAMLMLDYIELVPENIYNNSQYTEDMY